MRLPGIGLGATIGGVLMVAVAAWGVGVADAGQIAFSMTGQGVLEGAPDTVGEQSDYQEKGTATLFGSYTGDGRLRLDELTTPTQGKFTSALPFIVTAENGDQLCFTYVGQVELIDAGEGRISTRWIGDFKPIVGSGTGLFEQVTGGSFQMTMETDAFVPGSAGSLAYRTAGSGSLVLVPEPAVAVVLALSGLVLGFSRRRRRALSLATAVGPGSPAI